MNLNDCNENSWLQLNMPADQRILYNSTKEDIEYFQQELAKRDQKILELQAALNQRNGRIS
jgi:hypothetical protein